MPKEYKQILPVENDNRVSAQFGLVPFSVMEFVNKPKWKCAYFKQNENEVRRSKDAHWLASLKLSEFSSAVCEFIIRYWSLKNAVIVDPFAGRATRAIISARWNRQYYGYEISPSTYDRCLTHFKSIGVNPTLYLNDGCLMSDTSNDFAHLVMTCPPYGDLEKYESVTGQLSDIKDYDSFLLKIKECITNVYRVLKPGGFSCWVVADWRDSDGYKAFTNDTFNIFRSVGFKPHDTIILKNNSPFAALQTYKCACKRITTKIHETLLVFRKPGELDITGLEIDSKSTIFDYTDDSQVNNINHIQNI